MDGGGGGGGRGARDHIEVSDASSAPVVWVVGFVPVRNVFCNLPPQNKDNHAKHDIVPATCAIFEMGSCPACRKLARVRHQQIPIAGGLTTRCRSRGPPGGGGGGGVAARDPRPYIEVIRVIRGLNSIFFVLWIAIVRDHAV